MMPSRSRPFLVWAVAITWLVLGPLAVLHGACVIMCDTCDVTCPAAPGVEYAPRADALVVFHETLGFVGKPHLSVSLTPPAPPPKSLLSA